MTLVLMIMDGWGYSEKKTYNAIHLAHKPQWNQWWQQYSPMILEASGSHVGLPENHAGNSEVGHMHIGAGRVIQQSLSKINQAIESEELAHNPILLETLTALKKTGKSLHLLGLLSPGGVHSHEQHLFALLKIFHQAKFHSVFLHLFLDGIDTPKQSALLSITALVDTLQKYPVAQIQSISGRYYAMAANPYWDRIEPIYQLLTESKSKYHFEDPITAIKSNYQLQINDDFIPATLIGKPKAIEDGDAVFYFNFRSDRARQLTTAFLQPSFCGFKRTVQPQLSRFLTMTQYDKSLPIWNLFPPSVPRNTLGEILSYHGLKQLRIAETEKFAHTTSFFNGGIDAPFENEDRILIPSHRTNKAHLMPQMNAFELTQTLIKSLNSKLYDVIICNYANADVLGHTGDFKATRQAIEYLDSCLYQLGSAVAKQGSKLLITSDHGNAEMMFDEITQQPYNAHTKNPVPFIYVGNDYCFNKQQGSLIHIAPIVLTLLGIKPPTEMAEVLLEKK